MKGLRLTKDLRKKEVEKEIRKHKVSVLTRLIVKKGKVFLASSGEGVCV